MTHISTLSTSYLRYFFAQVPEINSLPEIIIQHDVSVTDLPPSFVFCISCIWSIT